MRWSTRYCADLVLQGSIFSDELRSDVAFLNLRRLSCIVWSKNPRYQLVGSLFGRHDRYANEGVSRSMSSIGGPAYDHIHHLVGASPSTKRNRASNSNFMKPDGNIDVSLNLYWSSKNSQVPWFEARASCGRNIQWHGFVPCKSQVSTELLHQQSIYQMGCSSHHLLMRGASKIWARLRICDVLYSNSTY